MGFGDTLELVNQKLHDLDATNAFLSMNKKATVEFTSELNEYKALPVFLVFPKRAQPSNVSFWNGPLIPRGAL